MDIGKTGSGGGREGVFAKKIAKIREKIEFWKSRVFREKFFPRKWTPRNRVGMGRNRVETGSNRVREGSGRCFRQKNRKSSREKRGPFFTWDLEIFCRPPIVIQPKCWSTSTGPKNRPGNTKLGVCTCLMYRSTTKLRFFIQLKNFLPGRSRHFWLDHYERKLTLGSWTEVFSYPDPEIRYTVEVGLILTDDVRLRSRIEKNLGSWPNRKFSLIVIQPRMSGPPRVQLVDLKTRNLVSEL